jgi:hypothetical protein
MNNFRGAKGEKNNIPNFSLHIDHHYDSLYAARP